MSDKYAIETYFHPQQPLTQNQIDQASQLANDIIVQNSQNGSLGEIDLVEALYNQPETTQAQPRKRNMLGLILGRR